VLLDELAIDAQIRCGFGLHTRSARTRAYLSTGR
jgi:hypothetical protein